MGVRVVIDWSHACHCGQRHPGLIGPGCALAWITEDTDPLDHPPEVLHMFSEDAPLTVYDT